MDFEEKYMYLLAEFQNYKRRTAKEIENEKQFKNEELLIQLLEVIDSLENSLKFSDDFLVIFNLLMNILQKNGLKEITANEGDDFNDSMNAISVYPTNDETMNNKIARIVRKGYEYNGKIIRHCEVIVFQYEKLL